jgi:hypothetical protein
MRSNTQDNMPEPRFSEGSATRPPSCATRGPRFVALPPARNCAPHAMVTPRPPNPLRSGVRVQAPPLDQSPPKCYVLVKQGACSPCTPVVSHSTLVCDHGDGSRRILSRSALQSSGQPRLLRPPATCLPFASSLARSHAPRRFSVGRLGSCALATWVAATSASPMGTRPGCPRRRS